MSDSPSTDRPREEKPAPCPWCGDWWHMEKVGNGWWYAKHESSECHISLWSHSEESLIDKVNRVALASQRLEEAKKRLEELAEAAEDAEWACDVHAGHCIEHHQRTPCAFETLRTALAAARKILGDIK